MKGLAMRSWIAGLLGAILILMPSAHGAAAQEMIRVRGGAAYPATVVECNAEEITVKTERETKSYFWRQLDPKCVYDLVQNRMDKTSAAAHWALAEYCAAAGLVEEARSEYRLCVQTDFSYKEKTDKAWRQLDFTGGTKRSGPLPAPVPEGLPAGTMPMFPEPGKDQPKTPASSHPTREVSPIDVAVVAGQRKHAEVVNARLRTHLQTYETEHFILHIDFADPDEVSALRRKCEPTYERLSDVLDLKTEEKIWAGKCEGYFFQNRVDFARFAAMTGFPGGESASGYFHFNGRQCRIVIVKPGKRSVQSLQEIFVHELTHAFVMCRMGQVHIKPWLNEGLAQYMQLTLQPESSADRKYKLRYVKEVTKRPGFPRFNDLRQVSGASVNDSVFYVLSWSIVDYMISSDPSHAKFRKFVVALKEGKSDEEAIQEAYGENPGELELAWLKHLGSLQ